MDARSHIEYELRYGGIVDAAVWLHHEFIQALHAELAATHAADLREAITLPRGEPVESDGVFTVYRFEFDFPLPRWVRFGPHNFREHGYPAHRVKTQVIDDRTLVIGFHQEHSAPFPAGAALLWPNRRWMIYGLMDRLTEIDRAARTDSPADPPFHLHAAFAALGLSDPLPACLSPEDVEARVLDDLDVAQRAAVCQSLASRAHFVWGAPGTGKTRTVSAVAVGHFRGGRSVVIATPTHAASDLILNHVCNALSHESGFGSGLVIRLGKGSSEHLQPEHADAVRFDRVLERELAELRSKERELIREQRAIEQAIAHSPAIDPGTCTAREVHLSDVRHELSAVHSRITALPSALLDEAQVVSGTCHGVVLSTGLRRAFDAAVVDEASMAPLPWIYGVAGLARSHVTIAGDFMQLPPPVATKDTRALAALATDPFRLAGHADAVAAGRQPKGLSILAKQYRMHKDIWRVVGPIFYSGLVLPARSDIDHIKAPVIVLDTSLLRPTVHKVRGSRENIVHAAVTVAVVSGMLEKREVRGEPPPSLTVLTPYRAQTRLVRARIRRQHPDVAVLVSTIHGSQGSGREAVIVDLTDSSGLPPGPFLGGSSVHSVGARLINVALSRARDHLIVVVDLDFVSTYGGAAVRGVLSQLLEVGRVVPAGSLLRTDRRRPAS